MEEVVKLALGCSNGVFSGAFGEAIGAICASANRTAKRLRYCYFDADPDFVIDFGPLIGRRFAEEIAAILLGRLDPIRLVVSIMGAKSADYVSGALNKSSLSWFDDIIPEFDASAKAGHWSQQTLKKNEIVRGLLSGQLAHSVFESGFYSAIDAIQGRGEESISDWVRDVQKFVEGSHLLADMRRRAAQVYSHLSKGIHFEFMSITGAAIEPDEIKRLLSEMLYMLATTSLVVNCSGLAHGATDRDEICGQYIAVSKLFSA